VVTVVVFFGPLLVLAIATLPNLLHPTNDLKVPFLRDWNLLFIGLVTLPLLVTLLLIDKAFISREVSSLLVSGAVVIDKCSPVDFRNQWAVRYRKANLLGQLIGVVVGVIAFLDNYYFFTSNASLGIWHTVNGSLTAPGWAYTVWTVPTLFGVLTLFAVRTITTIRFLKDLAEVSSVVPLPFHPDGAAGMAAVGRLGLRTQCLVVTGGVNVLLALLVAEARNPGSSPHYALVVFTALYVLGAPFLFLGPLLPFHKRMRWRKKLAMEEVGRALEEGYARVMEKLRLCKVCNDECEQITRLRDIRSMVMSIPVWPVGSSTAKAFLAAYALPLAAGSVSALVRKLVEHAVIPG